MSEEAAGDVVATHAPDGEVRREKLPDAIEKAWTALIGSEAGRAQVAAMMGIEPSEVAVGPSPFALQPAPSGEIPPDVIVVAHWTAVNVVFPVLVGLAKDLVKARLVRLWRQLFVEEINSDQSKTIGSQIS